MLSSKVELESPGRETLRQEYWQVGRSLVPRRFESSILPIEIRAVDGVWWILLCRKTGCSSQLEFFSYHYRRKLHEVSQIKVN